MDIVPKLGVLPPMQRRLWSELGDLPAHFTLYGGTAIALQLGHRESIDFDFFSTLPLDPERLVPELPFLTDAVVTQRAPNTLSCTVDRGGPVRLSLFGLPHLPRLRRPHRSLDNGVHIATLLDLTGTKLAVVQVRAELKDYLDLDAILASGIVDLPTGLASGKALYGSQFSPITALKALTYFGDGTTSALAADARARLTRAAANVDVSSLPHIQPEPDAHSAHP